MEYIMTPLEMKLFKMIEQDGVMAPVQATIRALIEYAHDMSDLGLKEAAREALQVSSLLKDLQFQVKENQST